MKRIFLVIMVILGLVGCGSKKESTEDATTVTIVMKDFTPSNPRAVKFKTEIEKEMAAEGTTVHINLVEIPQGSYGEKLNLMIMSGEIPDIIYFQGGDEVMAQQGLLEDLRPFIAKSSIVQGAMEEYQKERVENYPYLLWVHPVRKKVPAIRKSWLDEYGKIPVTVDDFYDMFKYFHDTKGAYGVSDTGDTKRLDGLFNPAFGITSQWMKDDQGNYVYSKITKQEKTKLAFYRKLYAGGLLDPEYITTKWNTLEDKFYTKKTAMIAGYSGRVMDIYDSN